MFAPLAYFSFVGITDPAQHPAYNESQHLVLQPEIRALPGVAWSDRWVHTPDCAALNFGADPDLARIHYADITWFRAPVDVGIRGFRDACERASHIGEPLSAGWIERPLHGLFVPLKGCAHPRVRVAAEALPFRPARGVFLLVSRFARRDADAEAAYHWYDETRIPDLLECRGAAGAWSFATADVFRPDRDIAAPVLRIVQVYLDDDPLIFMTDVAERTPSWRRAGRLADTSGVEEVLFASPLSTIAAWQWDWFDRSH
jgi:hypothetical protein